MNAVQAAAQRGPHPLVEMGQWLGASDPTMAVSVALAAICAGIGLAVTVAVVLCERDSGSKNDEQ